MLAANWNQVARTDVRSDDKAGCQKLLPTQNDGGKHLLRELSLRLIDNIWLSGISNGLEIVMSLDVPEQHI